MIKIIKGDPPEILERKERELRPSMEADYDLRLVEYVNGKLKFEFTDDYRSSQVQAALLNCQHNKCCFSEAKFVGDYPHVEHFRPKGRIDEINTKKRSYPGYYW